MNNPLKKINVPAIRSSLKKVFNKAAIKGSCKKLSEFVYDNSKETALIMLVFNAISVLSGHLSQIGGLRKSNRENKEYLITQEKKELGLDIVLTIIPPFLINNALMKKLDSGQLATRSSIDKLQKIVGMEAGVCEKDLYRTDHIIPIKEQIMSLAAKISGGISNSTKAPRFLKNGLGKVHESLKGRIPDKKFIHPAPILENIVTDFDNIRRTASRDLTDKLYHGSAVDELLGQRNGLLIMATLGYTILAGNIVMPILKNKLTNKAYEKAHQFDNLTEETLNRHNRFKFTTAKTDKPGTPVFNEFFYKYSGDLRVKADSIDEFGGKINTIKQSRINDTFSAFSSAKSGGMKI